MKRPSLAIAHFLAPLMLILLTACIHTYPDGDGVDPTLVKVGVELCLDINWETTDFHITKSDGHQYRLVIEFSRSGEEARRCEHIISQEEFSSGNVKLIMPFDFHAVNYTVAAWLDCRLPDLSDNHVYDAGSISNVYRLDNHISWTDDKLCASARDVMNLQQYKDQWAAHAVVAITLRPPLGRFRILADDMDSFREFISTYIKKGETYSVCLAFERQVPKSFDVKDSSPANYIESPQYYFDFPPEGNEIASGAIFATEGKPTMLAARVLIYNSARMIVSRSPLIQFPIERGKITVITGELLSDFYTNSINVNNIWDGEIIIEI